MIAIALRNLHFYWRGNMAVLLGAAVAAAVLAGALFVGDSLRQSLRDRAERQAGGVSAAWIGNRLIHEGVAARLGSDCTPLLLLRGTARGDAGADSGAARVTVLGLNAAGRERFHLPAASGAVLSHALAEHLKMKPGGRIRVTVPQLSAVPKASLLGKRSADDLTLTLTLPVAAVLEPAAAANDFSLAPGPAAPLNLFVPLELLQDRLGKPGLANAILAFGAEADTLNQQLPAALHPADWGLRVHVPPARGAYVSVESEELVLSDAVAESVAAAASALGLRSTPTIVYLANWIASGAARIPYSIVAAVDPGQAAPLGPFLLQGVDRLDDDAIVLTDWAESPLKAVPAGAEIELTFFEPEIEGRIQEASAKFKLAGRIPLEGVARDPDLTPPFPGITDKLTIGEWNPPFPFDSTRIKPNDANEKYWEQYKTTPKAYITLAAGRRLFASRFGVVTSVRVAPADGQTPQQAAELLRAEIQRRIDPAAIGIRFDDISARLRQMSVGGTDFGGLFLGFSLFLIAAALLLVGLLVRLNVERRVRDIGTLLATGFTPRQVRSMLAWESAMIAVAGAVLGVLLALAYSRGLIALFAALWPDDSARAILRPHASWASAAAAFFAIVLMTVAAAVLAVRGLVKLPIPAMLLGRTEQPRTLAAGSAKRGYVAAALLVPCGVAVILIGTRQANPDFRAMAFFAGGGLLLAAGLACVRAWLRQPGAAISNQSPLAVVGLRNAGRFPGRSLLTVVLIATASFLLVAVESFRRTPSADSNGGFNLIAETDVPLFHPFDHEPGRGDLLDLLERETQEGESAYGEERATALLGSMRSLMPLRVHRGDDASCLNLYQAGRPQLVGVPQAMIDRGRFQFSASLATTDAERDNPWRLLLQPQPDDAIPIIGEQNSVMWMLKKAVGDTIELPDERGTPRRFRIVATLQDSVFQSELLIAESQFLKLFPREEGYSAFLIDDRGSDPRALGAMLETGFRGHGMIVSSCRERVAAYQAVIGTYLTTFQLLGALGLLLGVLGLAAVVLRGVWERLGEFALLQAVGYSPAAVRRLVLVENVALLALGLVIGILAAAASAIPQGGEFLAQLPRLLLLIAIVFAAGWLTVILATRSALRVPIMRALRNQ